MRENLFNHSQWIWNSPLMSISLGQSDVQWCKTAEVPGRWSPQLQCDTMNLEACAAAPQNVKSARHSQQGWIPDINIRNEIQNIYHF